MGTDMIPKVIHWPQDWIEAINAARGNVPFAEFVRECVRAKIGKSKLEPTRRRGRPKEDDQK